MDSIDKLRIELTKSIQIRLERSYVLKDEKMKAPTIGEEKSIQMEYEKNQAELNGFREVFDMTNKYI